MLKSIDSLITTARDFSRGTFGRTARGTEARLRYMTKIVAATTA
jgi:hypothetical protein